MNKTNSKLRAIFLFIFILLVLSPEISQSQVKLYRSKKFRPPVVTMEVLFGYTQPLPNLFGDVAGLFDFSSYGVKYGLGSQINIKLSANKKGTVRPYISFGYALFMGRDGSTAYIDSNAIRYGYPLPGSGLYKSTSGSSKIFLHNFSIGPGFEYDFVNKTRWTPFLGAELNINLIFGTYRQTPDIPAGAGPRDEVGFTIKQAVRFGFGVGGGIHLRVHKYVGFAFATKYKFANLLGKNSERITQENKMNLLDKADMDINTNLSKDRHIDYFEFMIGLVIYAGRR